MYGVKYIIFNEGSRMVGGVGAASIQSAADALGSYPSSGNVNAIPQGQGQRRSLVEVEESEEFGDPPRNTGAQPSRPQNVGAVPNRPQNVGAVPNRPKNIGASPDRPNNVGAVPGRPNNVEAAPNRPNNVEATPNWPNNVEATPYNPNNVEATPNNPDNVEATPYNPNNVEATPNNPWDNGGYPGDDNVEATPNSPWCSWFRSWGFSLSSCPRMKTKREERVDGGIVSPNRVTLDGHRFNLENMPSELQSEIFEALFNYTRFDDLARGLLAFEVEE